MVLLISTRTAEGIDIDSDLPLISNNLLLIIKLKMICNRCKDTKQLTDFNYKNKSLNIRNKICKICTRKQIRNHYYLNRQYYLDKTYKRNHINRELIRRYLLKYLVCHPCVDCGEKDPIVLEFDHQYDKIIHVSHMANHPLNKVKEEISKCMVRCANCHRRKTAKDYNWYKTKVPL